MSKPKQPSTDNLQLDRAEAIHAKHALQEALDLVNSSRDGLIPGQLADQLDQVSRRIVTGITALRDSDREERDNPFARSEDSRSVTCPNCDHEFSTRAKEYANCPACGKNMRLNVTRRLKKQKAHATRHSSPVTGGAQ